MHWFQLYCFHCFLHALDVSRLFGTLCYGFWKENGGRSKVCIKYGFRCDFGHFSKRKWRKNFVWTLFFVTYMRGKVVGWEQVQWCEVTRTWLVEGGWDWGSDSFVVVDDEKGTVICTDVKGTILLSFVVLLVTRGIPLHASFANPPPPNHVTITVTVPNIIVLKGPRSLKW